MIMGSVKKLKRRFGSSYHFEKYFSDKEIRDIYKNELHYDYDLKIATLRINHIRLDAVFYWNEDGLNISFDVYVKDRIDSPEWICFDNVTVAENFKPGKLEKEMVDFLNKEMEYYHLSYSECYYETVIPKGDKTWMP